MYCVVLTMCLLVGVDQPKQKPLIPPVDIRLIQPEIKQAQKENKYIFLYFSVDWCSYCRQMRGEVLGCDILREFMPKFYVVKYIRDNAQKFREPFHITAYPTYLILDKNGKELNRGVGYMPYREFIKWHNDTWKKR